MKPLLAALLAFAGARALAQEPSPRALLQGQRQALEAALRSSDAAAWTKALGPLPAELDSFAKTRPAGAASISKAKSDAAAALASPTRTAAAAVDADLTALLSPSGAAPVGGGSSALSVSAQRATAKTRAALSCAEGAFDGGACGQNGSSTVGVSVSPAGSRRQTATLAGRQRGLVTAPVPPVAAPAPSPQVQACRQSVGGYQSLAGMCDAGHTTAAPLIAGLFDALKGQFGTLSGVLMNVLFFLFGLLTSVATGGVGLILKLIGLIGMSWGLWQALRGLTSAVKQYATSPDGSPQKAQALRKLGIAGGGLLIMVMMALAGWGLGKTRAGGAATKAMESGMNTALEKTGLSGLMNSANVALAPLMAWLSKALPSAQNAPVPEKTRPAIAETVKPGEVGKVVDPQMYKRYRDAADKYGQDPDLIVAHMEAQGRGQAVPHDRLGHVLQEGPTCAACSIANACRLPTSDVPRLVNVLGEGPNASDVLGVSRQLGGKVVSASEIADTVHGGNPVVVAIKIGREAQHAIVIDGVFSHGGRTFYSATDSNFGHHLFFPEQSFDKMAATGGLYFPGGIDRDVLARLEPLPGDKPGGLAVGADVKQPAAGPKDYVDTNVLVHAKAQGIHPMPGKVAAQTALEISVGGPEMRRYLVDQMKSGRISMDTVPRDMTPGQRAGIEAMTRILVKYGFEPKDARMVSQIAVVGGDDATLYTRERRLTNQVNQLRESRRLNADLRSAGLGPLPRVVRVGVPAPAAPSSN